METVTGQQVHSNDSRVTSQGLRGYGAYLHLHQDESSHQQQPNTSIYGVTKRPKQYGNIYHPHNPSRNRADSSDPATSVHSSKDFIRTGGNKQYPPPDDYKNKQDLSCIQRHYHSSRGLDYSQEDNSSHGSDVQQLPHKHSSLQNHKGGQRQLPRAGNKREHQTLELKPYVPKRKRKPDQTLPGVSGGDAESGEVGDLFVIDPYITCQRNKSQTISKSPRQVFCSFNSHQGPVTHVKWNIPQYSHLLLSSSMDKTVRIWDYSNRKRCVQTLDCHEGAVKDAQWSADGQQILSCGFDKTARLTDVQSG